MQAGEQDRDDAIGGSAGVLARAARLQARGQSASLAVVLQTEGSTYVGTAAMALFAADGEQRGWLSGGCLEPEIARRALAAAASGRVDFLDVDTRDDEDLFSGSALGCRGRLLLALLPLSALPELGQALEPWRAGSMALTLDLAPVPDGWRLRVAEAQSLLPGAAPPETMPAQGWSLRLPAPPDLLVVGAGPETPTLLPLLRGLGWRVRLVESRERWCVHAALADEHHVDLEAALASRQPQAALVMQHNFERDRDALERLAVDPPAFVGLLGPNRRREDLFRVLGRAAREALEPVLHSPVGLPLGGRGPEAIALSIAAELQAWRHGRD